MSFSFNVHARHRDALGAYLSWGAYCVLLLMASFYLSWSYLASHHFFYEGWYESLQIGAFIDHYALQNRYKFGFEWTSRAERIELFASIVEAVQHHPEQLSALHYQAPHGSELIPLLREPEIKHLLDVSGLVNRLQCWGLCCLFGCVFLFFYIGRMKRPIPRLRRIFAVYLLLLSSAILLFFAIGARPVFRYLHRLVFSHSDSPWFFYYQDSLMTTLMKSPDLFAYLALLWLLFTAVVFVCLLSASITLYVKVNHVVQFDR